MEKETLKTEDVEGKSRTKRRLDKETTKNVRLSREGTTRKETQLTKYVEKKKQKTE